MRSRTSRKRDYDQTRSSTRLSSESVQLPALEFYPLTSDRWMDFERLFGKNGACGGCWCMWWRLKRSEFAERAGQKNKRMMKRIVDSGEIPGLLAYVNRNPVGWCSVSPREAYPVLERSPTLKKIDDKPAWSVVCFFLTRGYRRKGLMASLLKAAVEYAEKNGAKIVEGYPIDPKNRPMSGSEGFTGVISAFRKVGFVEVLRRSPSRPIMRYFIN